MAVSRSGLLPRPPLYKTHFKETVLHNSLAVWFLGWSLLLSADLCCSLLPSAGRVRNGSATKARQDRQPKHEGSATKIRNQGAATKARQDQQPRIGNQSPADQQPRLSNQGPEPSGSATKAQQPRPTGSATKSCSNQSPPES